MHQRSPALSWLAAVLWIAAASAPARADGKSRAYAIYVNLPDYGVSAATHGDTGPVDHRSGGSGSDTRKNISYGSVLHCDEVESDSRGDHCQGRSHTRLEAGWLLKGTPFEVTWQHLETTEDDACCRSRVRGDAPSRFVGLTFAGVPVTVTGKPNQTLGVPGQATLILNEARHAGGGDCDDDDREHRALHLILGNGDEVILGASKFESDGDCCSLTPTRASTWGHVKAHYR